MTTIPLAGYLGLLYFASEFVLGLVRRAKAGANSPADRGSSRVLWLVIMPTMFLAYQFEFGWRAAGWPPQPWVTVVGIAATLAGLALRWYSIIYLGRFFTVNVEIAADHQLIDTGPYRRLRHPSYTGALLAFFGLGLCTQNWASLAIIVVCTTAAFSYRMRVEEVALTGAFGDRYRQYMQRTWRLVPGVY
jgi:protein-S-isoprenylcysteine O-methyltransferase